MSKLSDFYEEEQMRVLERMIENHRREEVKEVPIISKESKENIEAIACAYRLRMYTKSRVSCFECVFGPYEKNICDNEMNLCHLLRVEGDNE